MFPIPYFYATNRMKDDKVNHGRIIWIPQDQTGSLWFKCGTNMNVKSSRWCTVQNNAFHDRWTKTADPNISHCLRRPTLDSDYSHLETPLSVAMQRPRADGERRPLCKLQTKIRRFQIWKPKLLSGDFAYYLDCWSESYSWFLWGNMSEPNLRPWLIWK